MTQPDDPGPFGEAIQAVRASIIQHQRARLPTAAELTDNATYAAMLDVMRQAEAMRRQAWARPCCAVCGHAVATPSVADGVAFHPACSSCLLERAFRA